MRLSDHGSVSLYIYVVLVCEKTTMPSKSGTEKTKSLRVGGKGRRGIRWERVGTEFAMI